QKSLNTFVSPRTTTTFCVGGGLRVAGWGVSRTVIVILALSHSRFQSSDFAGARVSAPASQIPAAPCVLFASNALDWRSFWSAPAERSGDGALDFQRATVLTSGSGVARAPNPKRRGASLPAAL